MAESIRILILEDDPVDAELVQFKLQEVEFAFVSKVVMTEDDFVRELQEFSPDLILSDDDLPEYNGVLALAEAKRSRPDTPFILVTGAVTEDRAIDILTQGAKDYVLKARLQQRLVPAVKRALAEAAEHRTRKQAEAELREAHRNLEERVRIRTAELEAEMTARKKTEEVLQDSEKRYRRLFESAKDGILILDADTGRVEDVNPFLLQLLGYSYDALYGKHIWELGAFKDIAASKDAFKALQENEYIRYDDLPLETLNGHPIAVEFVSNVYLVDHHKVIQCNIRDITQRKKMEETLGKQDIQLKKLTSWVPGMMYQFTKRPDGTYCVPFSTEAIKDIFGCSPEDVRDDFSPIARVILPADLDKVLNSIAYSAKHLTVWTCEYRVQIPGQSIRWILGKSAPEKLADGSITWYGFNTDITETKKVEEALRKSEEEFRSLAESMPQIVWITRKDGWNIYFNQQWVDYTGLTLEESYGHGWNIPFHPDDQQRAWRAWEKATQNNGIYSLECRLRRADGVYRWWLVRGVPLRDERGEIIKWFGTCTDIDKIKHTEEQLQDTLESLRKAFGATIQVMVSAVETRDPYTSGHQIRSADLARAIATEMDLPQDTIDGIRMAGSIHDIGKLSIPAEILSKPTKLSEIEFSLIKEHSRKGSEILKDVESPWPLAEIVYQHHERMDGSGYPRHLKGEEICMEARILSVADVVEAMASHRPYRAGLGIDAAMKEIEKNKGILYDEAVAEACLRLFREKGFQLRQLEFKR